MKCAVHSDVEATGYCRNCGKPLCPQCARHVRGALYCEECLAAVMSRPGATSGASASQFAPSASQFAPGAAPASAVPPPAYYGYPHPGPNPGAALILGFVPGLGAVYNGEYVKALIHVLIFGGVIAILSSNTLSAGATAFAGVFLGLFCCYMPVEAYRTARAKRMGQPPPSFFAAPAPGASEAGVAGEPQTGAAAEPVERRAPLTGGIILIIFGVLFLLGTMGMLSSIWWDRLWPLILVVLGVWLLWRRTQRES